MTWDQPSTAVAEAEAALFAEAQPRYRCACRWEPPTGSDCPEIQHQFHRQNCQATWSQGEPGFIHPSWAEEQERYLATAGIDAMIYDDLGGPCR